MVRQLSSGWWRLETPSGVWAQVPPNFQGRETSAGESYIPDEFIHAQVWQRENHYHEMQDWWRDHGEAELQAAVHHVNDAGQHGGGDP